MGVDDHPGGAGEKHPDYVAGLHTLARVQEAQGDYTAARRTYRQAILKLVRDDNQAAMPADQLPAAEQLLPLPLTVATTTGYARLLHQALGRDPDAAQLRECDRAYALAIATLDRLREEGVESEESKAQLGASAYFVFAARMNVLHRLFALSGSAADLVEAFRTAEQGTARVFLESLGKARRGVLGGVDRQQLEDEQLRRTIRQARARYEREMALPDAERSQAVLNRVLEVQRQSEMELEQLVARVAKENRRFAALHWPKPCQLEEARRCLTQQEVALVFVPGSEQSYVLLIEARPSDQDPANGIALYSLKGAAALAELVDAVTDTEILRRPSQVIPRAEEAYQDLFGSFQERIRGKDLVIVPGGPLCHLPFELLREPAAGKKDKSTYLVETHRIRYAASLTALWLTHEWDRGRTKPDALFWAMGDPVYEQQDDRLARGQSPDQGSKEREETLRRREGRGDGTTFSRLKYSGTEVRSIAALLGAPPGSAAYRARGHGSPRQGGITLRAPGQGTLCAFRDSRRPRGRRHAASFPCVEPRRQ